MKHIKTGTIYLLAILLTPFTLFAQAPKAKIDSSYHNWYYQQRMDLYENVEVKGRYDIVFLGNSITERGEWNELLPGKKIANRGIGGDNTFGVLARIDNVIKLQPKKLFILIGINDLGRGLPVEVIANNYKIMLDQLKAALPKTKIYLQSVLPLNEGILKYDYLKGKEQSIKALNEQIQQLAKEKGLTYINLHEVFADQDGRLKNEWTPDGIHLQPVAYVYWVEFLKDKKYL